MNLLASISVDKRQEYRGCKNRYNVRVYDIFFTADIQLTSAHLLLIIVCSFHVNAFKRATLGSIYENDYNKVYDKNVNLKSSMMIHVYC